MSKLAVILRIELIKALHDILGMIFILSKNNSFAQSVTALDLDSSLHKVLQYSIHCLFIEYELIQLSRWDKIRNISVLSEVVLIAFLILGRKIIVCYTFFKELGLDFIVIVWHKNMIGIYRRFVVVGIGRHTVLNFKEVVCIAVNVHFGSCSKSYHNSIEILEYGTVLFEDTSVTLVGDYKVEVCRRKQWHTVLGLGIVYGVKYRGISREHDTGVPVVLVAAQVTKRHIRQIVLEIVLCLFDKSCSVSKEQYIRNVTAAAENIGQAGCCSGLSRTSCHYKQSLTEALLDVVTHSADSFLLIVAVGYLVINRDS